MASSRAVCRSKRKSRRTVSVKPVLNILALTDKHRDLLLAVQRFLLKHALVNGTKPNRRYLTLGAQGPAPQKKVPCILVILPQVLLGAISHAASNFFIHTVYLVRPAMDVLAATQVMFGSAVQPVLDFDPAEPGPFQQAILECAKPRRFDGAIPNAIRQVSLLPRMRGNVMQNEAEHVKILERAAVVLQLTTPPYFFHHHRKLYCKTFQKLLTIKSRCSFLTRFRNLVLHRIENWTDGPADVLDSLVRFYQECDDRNLLQKAVQYRNGLPCRPIVCTADAEDPKTTLVDMLNSQKVAELFRYINQQTEDTKDCKNCSRFPRACPDKARLPLFRSLLVSMIPIQNITRHADQGYQHTISENTSIAVLLRIACTHKMTWIQQEGMQTLKIVTKQQWWTFVQTLTDKPANQELMRYLYCVHCELKVLLGDERLEQYLLTLARFCEDWIDRKFTRYMQKFPVLYRLVHETGGIAAFLKSPGTATTRQSTVINEKYRVFRHDYRSFLATRSYNDVGVDTKTCSCCWVNETTRHARGFRDWDDGVCRQCIERRCLLGRNQPIGPGHLLHPVNQKYWKKPTREMQLFHKTWEEQIKDPDDWPQKPEDLYRGTHYCGLCSHKGCRRAVRRKTRQCSMPIFWREIPPQYRPLGVDPADEIPSATMQTFDRDMKARLDPDLQRRIHNSICLANGRISEMILPPAACIEHDMLKLTPDMRECPGCGHALSHDGACLSTYCHCGQHFCIHCMQNHGYGVGCFPLLQDAYCYRGGHCRWCHEHIPFKIMCTHNCRESGGEFQRLYRLYFDNDGNLRPRVDDADASDDDYWG